ncbi:MAG: efflux RND transporter periplasmic adaptor subunit, partial [Pirellulales bacterium]
YAEKRFERVKKLVEERGVDSQMVDEQEEKLSTAKTALKAANSRLESAKALVRPHEAEVASAQATLELAAARVRVAEAKLSEVKRRGEAVQIVSPLDGVVVEMYAHVGDFVEASDKSTPICTVADLRRMATVVKIPEIDALKVQRGAAARVFLDAFPGKVFAAQVSRVAFNIDPKTRTLAVDLDLDADNSNGRLIPGMFGAAAVELERHRDVLTIPRSARFAPSGVLKVVDGRAIPQTVELGAGSYDRWEISSGMEEGNLIVTGLAGPKQKQPDWRQHPRVEIVGPAAAE